METLCLIRNRKIHFASNAARLWRRHCVKRAPHILVLFTLMVFDSFIGFARGQEHKQNPVAGAAKLTVKFQGEFGVPGTMSSSVRSTMAASNSEVRGAYWRQPKPIKGANSFIWKPDDLARLENLTTEESGSIAKAIEMTLDNLRQTPDKKLEMTFKDFRVESKGGDVEELGVLKIPVKSLAKQKLGLTYEFAQPELKGDKKHRGVILAVRVEQVRDGKTILGEWKTPVVTEEKDGSVSVKQDDTLPELLNQELFNLEIGALFWANEKGPPVFKQNFDTLQPTGTPEPATWLLGLTGLAAVIGTQARKSRQRMMRS